MTGTAPAFAVGLIAAYGVLLIVTGSTSGWRGLAPAPALRPRRRGLLRRYLAAGPARTAGSAAWVALAVAAVLGAAGGYALFAGVPSAAVGGLAGLGAVRARLRAGDRRRAQVAADAWPRIIEEIRMDVVTRGRSVPNAVFTAGGRAPAPLAAAFAAAHREWLITTEFERSLDVLRHALTDPTADVVCETLLTAHEVGGTQVDRRLRDLVEDRTRDVRARRDARAKLAGARFARWFVIVVPIGMALVGLQVGDGREAFATPTAQLVVLTASLVILACWVWAGALLRDPQQERVLVDVGTES